MRNVPNLPLPFKTMSQELQEHISHEAKIVTLEKKDTPFLYDKLQKSLFIVLKGKIKSYDMNLETGKEQTLYIYQKNHILDTITLLDEEEHPLCYEILEETKVLALPLKFIRKLLYTIPEFSQKFYLYIAKQMRHLEEMIMDMSLYTTAERLAKLIAQDLQPTNLFKFHILEGLSNTETAKLLGTVRHVVERHLRELKNEQIITIVDRKIMILESKKLLNNINI